jgi:hypothetical protein
LCSNLEFLELAEVLKKKPAACESKLKLVLGSSEILKPHMDSAKDVSSLRAAGFDFCRRPSSIAAAERPPSCQTPRPSQRDLMTKKNALLRRAFDLSERHGCEVGVVLFTPGGRLVQFSSAGMAKVLQRYSAECEQPHEAYVAASVSLASRAISFGALSSFLVTVRVG